MVRFLVEKAELIKIKGPITWFSQQSAKEASGTTDYQADRILESSLAAKEYERVGQVVQVSTAYMNKQKEDGSTEFTVSFLSLTLQVYFLIVETLLRQWIVTYRYSQIHQFHLEVSPFLLTHADDCQV